MKKKKENKPKKFREIVIINKCFGGFSLSHEAVMYYANLKGIKLEWSSVSGEVFNYRLVDGGTASFHFSPSNIKRDDEFLIKTIKKLKENAETCYSKLKIVKIPYDVNWHIEEYDGMEHVAEDHRTWS